MNSKTIARLNRICKRITAFNSFQELLDANYNPSIYPPPNARYSFKALYWQLASAYDKAQKARDNPRRAYTGE